LHCQRVVDITEGVEAQTLSGLEPEVPFVAAATFEGAKPGYVFKVGVKGLGYYLDGSSLSAAGAAAPPPQQEEAKPKTAMVANSIAGKTLVLGVGKRVQDVKHKIWVASVHDPYSFRGPEDRATGGGQSDSMNMQQNGAPKGWSAPIEGEASVNADSNCSIM